MNSVIERVREKYPEYANVPDDDLTQKIADKYPEYLSVADFKSDVDRLRGKSATLPTQKESPGFWESAAQSFVEASRSPVLGATAPLMSDSMLKAALSYEHKKAKTEPAPDMVGKIGQFTGGLAGTVADALVSGKIGRTPGIMAQFGASGAWDEFVRSGVKALDEGKSIDEAYDIAKGAAKVGAVTGAAVGAIPGGNIVKEPIKTVAAKALGLGAAMAGQRAVENIAEQQLGLQTPVEEGVIEAGVTGAAVPIGMRAVGKAISAVAKAVGPATEAAVKEQPKTTGAQDASTIRSDERQIPQGGNVDEVSQVQGGTDIQRQTPAQPSDQPLQGSQPTSILAGIAQGTPRDKVSTPAPVEPSGQWRPAIRLAPEKPGDPGKVITGEPGQTHPDIIQANNINAESIDQRGFVDPQGNWKTREETAQQMGGPTDVQAGRKHSTDLPEAKGQSQEIIIPDLPEKPEPPKRLGSKATPEQFREVIADLKDKLSNSVDKLKALGMYFAGQEKGAKVAGESARKSTKEQFEMADRWLAADVENIRESLVSLAGQLPPKERGKLLTAITLVLKRPAITSTSVTTKEGTISPVENMYRKAAKVAGIIEQRIADVKLNQLSDEIEGFSKWGESQKVDVPFRVRIRSELQRFREMRKAGDLDEHAAQAFLDRLTSLRDIGRSEQNVKQALWQWQKEFAENELVRQETKPVESRPDLRPLPGEETPFSMKMRNLIRRAQDKSAFFDKALMPIDALFDLIEDAKGKYQGWLFRHARGPVDLAHNEARIRRNATLAPFEALVKELKLTPEQGERIGVYAHNLQEGGRERLIDMGLAPETIDRIVQSLTPSEKQAYQMMRDVLDRQLGPVQDLMRRLYNAEVQPEKDYFPMPRDWKVFEDKPESAKAPGGEVGYDELATWKALLEDMTPRDTHSTRKGFTVERQRGAKTPIRIDAFDIFRNHVNDVSYLLEMQPTLKRLGEVARGDLFREKYGNVGQSMIIDWLDTVARQGGVHGFKRWKMLDVLRRNTSLGIVGFRVASQLVHLSNIPYIVARIGTWFGTGLRESFTERGQAFIKRNFYETLERGGGEPAQVEAEQMSKGKIARAAFIGARSLDRIDSQGAVLGTYLKALQEKGADWQNYDRLPVDRAAQAKALVMARRAIASPIGKDVPQALSRGALTAGNVSLGRTLFQFQNIFLDQWSNIRLDLWQAGIRDLNPKQAATMFAAVLASVVAEVGIRESVREIGRSITGYEPKKQEETFEHHAVRELVRRFPFGGQLTTAIRYNESGIPTMDAFLGAVRDVPKAFQGKPGGAAKVAAEAAQFAGRPIEARALETLSERQKAVAGK